MFDIYNKDEEIDLNKLAKEITLREGGKVNLSIAQVKEVLKIILAIMYEIPLHDLTQLLKKGGD